MTGKLKKINPAAKSAKAQESMRDIIGRAIYEEPNVERPWHDLPEDKREPWRMDADRVIAAVSSVKQSLITCDKSSQAKPDIVDRLMAACSGHPAALIPWPHRLLHDAANEIRALRLLTAGNTGVADNSPEFPDCSQRW